jgi:hypothetical protein
VAEILVQRALRPVAAPRAAPAVETEPRNELPLAPRGLPSGARLMKSGAELWLHIGIVVYRCGEAPDLLGCRPSRRG